MNVYALLMVLSGEIQTSGNKSNTKNIWGICQSQMILSFYIYSQEWAGYLTKIVKESVRMMDRAHKLGIKLVWILLVFCTSSVTTVNIKVDYTMRTT